MVREKISICAWAACPLDRTEGETRKCDLSKYDVDVRVRRSVQRKCQSECSHFVVPRPQSEITAASHKSGRGIDRQKRTVPRMNTNAWRDVKRASAGCRGKANKAHVMRALYGSAQMANSSMCGGGTWIPPKSPIGSEARDWWRVDTG